MILRKFRDVLKALSLNLTMGETDIYFANIYLCTRSYITYKPSQFLLLHLLFLDPVWFSSQCEIGHVTKTIIGFFAKSKRPNIYLSSVLRYWEHFLLIRNNKDIIRIKHFLSQKKDCVLHIIDHMKVSRVLLYKDTLAICLDHYSFSRRGKYFHCIVPI